jgi:hypothetical protein
MPAVARLQLKSVVLLVAITIAVSYVLGFAFPAFRNPVAIFLACMLVICAYGAPRQWWREPDFLTLLALVSAVGLVLFLVAPSNLSGN